MTSLRLEGLSVLLKVLGLCHGIFGTRTVTASLYPYIAPSASAFSLSPPKFLVYSGQLAIGSDWNILENRSIVIFICRVAWLELYPKSSSGNNQSLALVLTGPLNVHCVLLISELIHCWPGQSVLEIPTDPCKQSWPSIDPPERRGSGHSCPLFNLIHASSTLPISHKWLV